MDSRRADAQAASATAAPPPLRVDSRTARDAELPGLRQRLVRYARVAIRDAGAAEDLVQDTLIVVVEQSATRRGEASLLTWAVAILKNKIADWYRSPTRRRMVQLDDHAELDAALDGLYDAGGAYLEPVPAWQQPENQIEQRQMMGVLERCIGCLPSQMARIFMMREWLGFETAEICGKLGITADNCRMIMHRARMSLRACMERDWIGGRASR